MEDVTSLDDKVVENSSENLTEENETPENRCVKCQALLKEGEDFCPECGTPQKRRCPNCNAELQDGQVFCATCGQKTEQNNGMEIGDGIAQFNASLEKKKSKKKLIPILIGVVAVFIVAVCLLFTTFLNPQHYIEKGDYKTAYNITRGENKESTLRENIVAVVSADCVNSLKDSASFNLRDAWIMVDGDTKRVLLKVSANNSYGNAVINYWYYGWDKEKGKYTLYTTFADFNEEKTYSWDDSAEVVEKIIKNGFKEIAAGYVSGTEGVKIDSESIDRINKLFDKKILDKVTLIDAEPQKTK